MSEDIKTGQAGKQIVWYFDKPTIVVCETCEVPLYYDVKKCPYCSGEVTYFTKEQE